MNKSRRPQPINWTRIVAIGIILAIVGFQWYQNNRNAVPTASTPGSVAEKDLAAAPSDEKYRVNKLETQPSTKTSSDRSEELNSKRSANSSASVERKTKTLKEGSDRDSNIPGSRTTGASKTNSFLQPAGGKNLKSPAGLIYGMGSGGEHRVDHVMRHAQDDLNRPSHGVFDGDQETILRAIDEAYMLVKAKSKRVKTEFSQGNTSHTVSLGRRIGYEGGEKGQRSNNKPLKSIRLILDGERVITAYPYR